MKRLAKTTVLLFLIAISITFTQCENTVESNEITPSFQVVDYDALPAAIQLEVTATENKLKNAYAYKNDKPFGNLVANRIHQRLKSNGNTSYTLGLSRAGEGFYYDNLVINEDEEGNLKSRIIRYQPDPEWFYQHKTEGVGYDTYSGDIIVFNSDGEELSSVTLVFGQPQKLAAKTTASKANETNCEIVDVQEAGLFQEGVFYVYEITITVDCSGTGTGGGYEEEGMNNGFGNEGGEEGGGGGSPGGGGGNGGPGEPIDTVPVEEAEIVVVGPDTPINDVADYLNCFDSGQNATLTIYVNEPNPGSGDAYDGTFVGHAFVSISQGSNTSVYGFYPTSNWITPGINNSSSSVLGDDGSGSEAYSASMSTVITGGQLQQIIDFSVNYNSTYHLNTYNCTDFAIDIGNLGGLSLPEANGTWPGGGGSNPGTLGAHIRTTSAVGTIINTTGGTAPSTNKGC